jgi:hypothetical protein
LCFSDALTVSLSGQYHGEADGVAGQVPRTSADGSYLAGDEIRTLGDTFKYIGGLRIPIPGIT